MALLFPNTTFFGFVFANPKKPIINVNSIQRIGIKLFEPTERAVRKFAAG
jgi:hypothetical protein